MGWLLAIGILLAGLGWLALRRAGQLRRASGLPTGRLIYADTSGWQPPPTPFYSESYRLTGRPDYLVRTEAGLIPVEVKSGQAPRLPYLGHLLQLAAYCLLIEETTGQAPPHGLLKYRDALYEVDYTAELHSLRSLRSELLHTLAEMRQAYEAENVPRHHSQPNRCAACDFRHMCGEALE